MAWETLGWEATVSKDELHLWTQTGESQKQHSLSSRGPLRASCGSVCWGACQPMGSWEPAALEVTEVGVGAGTPAAGGQKPPKF